MFNRCHDCLKHLRVPRLQIQGCFLILGRLLDKPINIIIIYLTLIIIIYLTLIIIIYYYNYYCYYYLININDDRIVLYHKI